MVLDTFSIDQIVTGERLQEIADVYLGKSPDNFWFNPRIGYQTHKHKYFSDFEGGRTYNNPRVVFCYSHLIRELSEVIHLFENPFVLITHNSDENMVPEKPEIDRILECYKVLRWYSQNVGIIHPKLRFLPIGIANQQWPHGNLDVLWTTMNNMGYRSPLKTKNIYMCFSVDTNRTARTPCLDALANKIPFLGFTNFYEHLYRMSEYRFCICPIGNGLDTHRLWECYYLRVVPIVLKNAYSVNIQKTTGLPMILLDSWSDLFIEALPDYETFVFGDMTWLSMEHYKKEIYGI